MTREPWNNWQGCNVALRQLPPGPALHDPDAWHDSARSVVWLAVKTIVGAAAVVLLYAIAGGA